MNQINLPQRSSFASCLNGKDVDLYHLTNGKGIDAYITNYGARIVALIVPDKDGNRTDVVLGHDSLQEYIDSEEQYFGAVCGRYANRIARGSFSIDGRCYSLPINNGPNSLHGGINWFNTNVSST